MAELLTARVEGEEEKEIQSRKELQAA